MVSVLLKEKERVCYGIVVLKSYFRCILIDQLVCVVFFFKVSILRTTLNLFLISCQGFQRWQKLPFDIWGRFYQIY